MLTLEVVHILKKAILLSLALALSFCSHLRPVWDITVEGRPIDCRCSPAGAKKAQQAALAAAEEILQGSAEPADFSCRVHLSLRPGADLCPALCDALLKAQPGIAAGSCVYVGECCLGAVAEAKAFQRSFSRYIENTLPTWAKGGWVSSLSLIPRYTRTEYIFPDEDMIMLVTGLSPVMYYDGKGRVSPV